MITMEAMEGGEGGFWSYSGYIYMTLRLDLTGCRGNGWLSGVGRGVQMMM